MLEAYKSYADPHLTDYWSNSRKWNHLVKTGVITRNGTPIDEITARFNDIKDYKQRVADETEAERAERRAKEIDSANEKLLRQKMEEIDKLRNVLRVKSGKSPRARVNGRYAGPFLGPLSPNPPRAETRGSGRQKVRLAARERGRRTNSAPLSSSGVIIVQEKENSMLASEIRSTPPGSAASGRVRSRASSSLKTPPGYHVLALDVKNSTEGTRPPRAGRVLPRLDDIDSLSITELEQKAGLKLSKDKKQRYYPWIYADSPYLESQMPHEWRSYSKSVLATGSSKARLRARSKSASPSTRAGRSTTAMSGKKSPANVTELYRRVSVKEESLANENENWEQMEVRMRYHGDLFNGQRDDKQPFDEIIVEQQHCGGNTVNVFRGNVVPGEEFSFVSHRHPGYPFSLNLYVNGKKDCRVSTCCEYKHTRGLRLGSKSGQFSIADVIGGGPCRKCKLRMVRRARKKEMIVNYGEKQQKSKDSNDHEFYPLIISVEGDEIYGASIRNDDNNSNDYTDDDDDDDDDLSDDDVRPVHSPNSHDFYALKVAIEDDDYDSRTSRPNSRYPGRASEP